MIDKVPFQAIQYVGVIEDIKYEVGFGVGGWCVYRKVASHDREVLVKDYTWQRLLNSSLHNFAFFHSEQAAFDFIRHGDIPKPTLKDIFDKC